MGAPPTHGHTKDGTPVHAKTQHYLKGETPVQRFNAKVGLTITLMVGTMWAAYLFAIIAFTVLPSVIQQHSATVLILWLSSEFLQLVFLPIIIVGQTIQSRAADARATKTFEDVEDARNKIKDALDLLDLDTAGGLRVILDRLEALEGAKVLIPTPVPPPPPKKPSGAPVRRAAKKK